MKSILLVGDYTMAGSGYKNIIEGLALELSKVYDVTVLGQNYHGEEHSFPYRLIATHAEWVPQHILALYKSLKVDWVVLFYDIPQLIAIRKNINQLRLELKIDWQINYAAAFPVEADPLLRSWALDLALNYKVLFTFTNLGMRELTKHNLPANLLQPALDPFWYEDQVSSQTDLMSDYVLMVADNQVRKNLVAGIEAVGIAGKLMGKELLCVLVTMLKNENGWKLEDDGLYKRLGIARSQIIIMNSDISRDHLKFLYKNARCLLMPSVAEGIGFPAYEAQAVGCPILVTEQTGAAETVSGNIGSDVIKVLQTMVSPWGNVNWRYIDVVDAASKIVNVRKTGMRYKYPEWGIAASKLSAVLEEGLANVQTIEGKTDKENQL